MRRFRDTAVWVSVVGLVVVLCGPVLAETFLDEDFDTLAIGTAPDNSASIGGWEINYNRQEEADTDIQIVAGADYTGDHDLFLSTPYDSGYPDTMCYHMFTRAYTDAEPNPLIVECDVHVTDDPSAYNYPSNPVGPTLILYDGSLDNGDRATSFAFRSEAGGDDPRAITIWGPTAGKYGHWEQGVTYRTRCVVDFVTDTYDVLMLGGEYTTWTTVCDDMEFRDRAFSSVDRLSIGNYTKYMDCTVDNILAYTVPEPASVAGLLGLVLASLAVRLRRR